MGMDVYGLNPKIKKGSVKPKELNWANFNKIGQDKKELDKYFEEKSKYEEINKGIYFRNNVWWWRPLANLIREYNSSWLTEEQQERLHDNSGFEFSESEAMTIYKSLKKIIKNGTCKKIETEWKKKAKQAEKWNKGIEKQMDKLSKLAEKKLGKKDVAPINYPPEIKQKWDKLWESQDRTCSYPFAVRNVERFCEFLKECGGFKIC